MSKICRFFTLVACAASMACVAAPALVVVGPATHDFGEFFANEGKSARFTLKNQGDAALSFEVRPTCDCVVAGVDKGSVPPGGETGFELSLKPESLSGGFEKKIYVSGDAPTICLTLKGVAKTLLDITPGAAEKATRIKRLGDWRREFKLVPSVKGVKLGRPSVITNYPVAAELKELGGNYILRLDFKVDATNGALRAEAKAPVLSPVGWNDIKIKVDADVGLEFYCMPARVFLPKRADAAQGKQVCFKLPGTGFDPALVKCSAAGVRLVPGASGRGYQDAFTGNVEFSQAFMTELAAKGSATIYFEYPGAEKAPLLCVSN